ncbi:MAG: AraC family transcriptional regulator [Oscillospiraceae bacterium]
MGYETLCPLRPITVEGLVTVHYFEYSSSYYFEGESHDFWELLYVDKGELDVDAGETRHHLTRGQMIFHQPGEFHALHANGVVAPNLVVLTFVCPSPAMDFFRGRVLSVGATERALMGRIVEEASRAFTTPLGDPLTTVLVRRENPPFGSEQLIVSALEELLLRLCRGVPAAGVDDPLETHERSEFLTHVAQYLEANLSRSLTLEEVCRDNLVGRSRLQQIFRSETGGGVMAYLSRLKISAAQRMIREGKYNFTEIAAALGYQSIHYFSRHFKKLSGMTPSEYASSVKRLTEKTKAP